MGQNIISYRLISDQDISKSDFNEHLSNYHLLIFDGFVNLFQLLIDQC